MRSLYAHPIRRGISTRRLACCIAEAGFRNHSFLYQRGLASSPSSRRPLPLLPPASPSYLLARMASSSSSAPVTSAAATARFSTGSDEKALSQRLETLLESVEGNGGNGGGSGGGGRWALTTGGEGLERSFKFKTFAKTWVSGLR